MLEMMLVIALAILQTKYIDIELRERHRSAKKTASLNINSLTDSTFLPLLQLDPKLIKTKN